MSVAEVSLLIIGMALAGQVLVPFVSVQKVYAEESQRQALPKQATVGLRNKHDLKIREILYLQKDFGNPASALKTIDRLFGVIKDKIKPKSQYSKEEAIRVLKGIGDVLKEEGNFEYGKNTLLIEGLERQKNGKRFIDCDDYSSIYLAAGECLGLSLEPVYAPKHVFIRCRLENSEGFYWEPTLATEKDFSFYKDWLNIAEDSSYPKILNEKEFDAIQSNNLGVAWYEKGDYQKATEYLERALTLNPNFAEAFNNLGVAYAKQGNYSKALKNYNEATGLNPNYATPLSNIGVTFYRLGYLYEALKYFEKAIETDPKYDRAYDYKVVVLMKRGEHKKAFKFLKRYRKLK